MSQVYNYLLLWFVSKGIFEGFAGGGVEGRGGAICVVVTNCEGGIWVLEDFGGRGVLSLYNAGLWFELSSRRYP